MDLLRRFRYLLHRADHSAGLEEEMRLHLELRERQLRDRGLSPQDARFAARREFGNRAAIEIASSDAWGWSWWESLAQDLRHAIRVLGKSPGFAAIAVATLAVGIGMNTAVFSIVNAVMLRALPYPDPGRLISLWEEQIKQGPSKMNSSGSNLGGMGGKARETVSPANLMDYRRAAAFEGLAGCDTTAMNLTGNGAPERLYGESVTANYFALLGVAPALGRTFTGDEDREGADAVVVLTHRFWENRLGSDQAVLGRTIDLDGKAYRVIGVMPRDFEPITQFNSAGQVEFILPAAYSRELLSRRGDHEVAVIGRLRPGVSLAEAQAQLNAISASLAQQFPETNKGLTAAMAPARDDIVQGVSDGLSALLAASSLIVLITCLNVASLLLVRAAARRHETSVRLSLGAGRGRVLRAFLAESMSIGAGGCLTGVLLGRLLMRVLVAAAPRSIPRLDTVSLDWRVFGIAAAIAVVTGIVFGLAPAWQAAQALPADSLKTTERRSAGKAHARWRSALTVAEVALSLILMVGAGLFLKSFTRIMGMDLGFRTDHVLAMNINLPELRYRTAGDRLAFYQSLEARVEALPGVQRAAFANRLPMRGGWSTGIQMDNVSPNLPAPDAQAVSHGYFAALGIPVIRGRLLTPADRNGQPFVAVVNAEFSRLYLNGGDPIGLQFHRSPGPPYFTIVGVVSDVRRGGKLKDIRPQIYLSAAQTAGYPARLGDFAVRTAGDPRLVTKAIQQQVWAIDKDQPVTNVRTFDEIVSENVAEQRFQMLLLIVFAGVAVALAMIGVFGVLSYSVNQRMNEFGVRVALGAAPGRILGLVLRQAGVLIAFGVLFGLGGAWALTRLVGHLLFHVEPHDGLTYVAAVAALAIVALAAAMIPARRGALVDPVVALRDE
jgi:putative ABC transport system permease protein